MNQQSSTVFLGFAEERFPAGVHICQVFADDEERQESLLKFILSGLEAGERTACVSDKITEPVVSQFLDGHGFSCQEARASGAFFMSEPRETYLEGGHFDPERMLNFLARYYEDSMRGGYSAARVIGEMSAEIQQVPGGTRLLEYEARVSLLQQDHPVTAVCQYDARLFDGAMIMDILKVHPFMVVKGAVVYNPFYTPPEQFLASRGKQREELCPKKNKPALSAPVLGQLLLMQSIACAFVDERSLFAFICRGIADIPGVAKARYSAAPASQTEASIVRFPFLAGVSNHGELLITISDRLAFAPYEPYLKNFCFMMAIMLEEREQRKVIEANMANLEMFSYSLSHDMRAPLRAIHSYTDLFLLKHGEQVDASGKQMLEKVITSAQRMERLMEDVLILSQMSHQEIQIQAVAVEKLVRDLISESPEFQPPKAEIEIQSPLLPVRGHRTCLIQCFTNLLCNAVKFVASGVKPHVRIYSQAVGEKVRIWVADNGIGVGKETQERMFTMFHRGQRGMEYEGTGLGLAIVRKAVERMGGRVGVESVPGQGSRFWVELAGCS